MTFRQTVDSSKGGFEKFLSNIPGYHGYREKEDRRAADKLLRDYLAGQLDGHRRRLAELQAQMVDGGNLLLVDDVEQAVTKVQKLADAIRTASYGYAGIFDAVKVKEEQLDALYNFDSSMVDKVAAIQSAVDGLANVLGTDGDVKKAIKDVVAAAEAANATWRQRTNAITGATQTA